METVFKVCGREWLNSEDSYDTGALQYFVEVFSYKDGEPPSSVDASFSAQDCSRKISLDFSFFSEEQFKERLHKVDILICHLMKFRQAMEDGRNACVFEEDKIK